MDPRIIAAIVVVLLVAAVVGFVMMRRRESQRLHEHFGPEYERQVEESGSRAKAESALLQREKRIEKLDIRPLPPQERRAFMDDWQDVQASFVDDPEKAIALADGLVGEVMKARGYPVEDFEQRAADISVEHPGIVSNYRAAHEIALRHRQGRANTEDLRAAFIGYRSLFEELLREDAAELAH